jgi:predicted transposase YdaD
MPKAADIGSKRLIGTNPTAWVKWLIAGEDIQHVELIASEYQWERHGTFLIANEIQMRPDRRMARRMRAYAALAEEHYNLPVLPVVVNVLRGQEPIPEQYLAEFLGLVARQDYRVIRLWEVDVSLVFDQHLSALLPFVPALRGGQKLPIIARAVQLLRADESLRELEPLLALLATFVVDTDTVLRIMRLNMTELRESPWYSQIVEEGYQKGLEQGLEQGIEQGLEQGIEQGREQGIEQGREQGTREAQLRMVLRMFEHRFGEPDPALAQHIRALNSEQLDRMVDVILDAADRTAVISQVPDTFQP